MHLHFHSRPILSAHLAWMVAVWACVLSSTNASIFADEPTTADIFQVWRARQARTDHLQCRVNVLANYAAGSQMVPGEQFLMPVASRSSRRSAKLLLQGPAKWRIDHQGHQFHRRLGRMLNFDLTRVTNGNQYLLDERGYDEVPDWQPQPRVYPAPKAFRQELYWNDVTLAPILLHYRPFNSQLCPFEERAYVVDKEQAEVNSHRCLFVRPRKDAPFSVRTYLYWVAPELDMSVIRIQRMMNGQVEWQFDIEAVNDNGKWRPKSYVIRRMGNGGQMLEFSKVTLTELKTDLPATDDRFAIKPTAR